MSRKLYLLAWSILLVAIGIEYLRNMGLLPSNLFTILTLKVTFFLELLIASTKILFGYYFNLKRAGVEIKEYKKKSENRFLKNKRDAQRLQQKHNLLNKLAGIDSLAGLYNRREFFNITESLIFGAKNSLTP